ncbi:MAG: hypothetical protein AAF253_06995 [Pseudomonadota bacterium]
MTRLAVQLGATALVAAAIYHVVLLFGPPDWTAFAGAPPEVVQSLEEGTWHAPVSILFIAAALVAMAAYGYSAAGRLPLLRLGLWVIAVLFLLRGAMIVPQLTTADFSLAFDRFHLFASLVVLLIGAAYLLGALRLEKAR